MTTEFVLLLSLFATVLLVALTRVPRETFVKSGPKLAARIERHLATGRDFRPKGEGPTQWLRPR